MRLRVDLLPAPTDAWSRATRTTLWRRFVQFAPIRFFVGLLFVTPAAVIFQSPQFGHVVPRELAAALALPAFYLSLLGYARIVERRPPVELGTRRAVVELAAGLALGALLVASVVGALVLLGFYRVGAGDGLGALASGLLALVTSALFEEILFRVLLFKITEESLGSWPALLLQAAAFGALHLGNPHATLVAGIAIAVEAGILLAAAYALTRRIWLAWGIHVGWNLTQSNVLGVPDSGEAAPTAMFHAAPTGPDAWTGGAFGIEASPVSVVLCLCVAIPILFAAYRQGRLTRSARWVAAHAA